MKITTELYSGISLFALRTFTFLLLLALGANGTWASFTCPNTLPMFSGFTDYSLGSAQEGIETGDFNNDGKLDLITADYNGSVSLALGNGTGGFGTQSTTTLSGASGLRAVVVADFNADGKLDFATSNNGSANISVGYGNGSGGFSTIVNYSTNDTGAPDSPFELVVGDFNNDSAPDIATSNGSSFSIFDNGGSAFTKRPNVTGGGGGYGITTNDFDSDGKLDLFITKNGNPGTVFYNNGISAWTSYVPLSNEAVFFLSTTSGDFDQDGNKDDLVVGGVVQGGNSIHVLTGNTNRTMTSSQSTAILNYWGGGMRVGDFNADTKTDIGLASGYNAPGTGNYANVIFFALNQGGGVFGDTTAIGLGSNHTTADIAVGDFDLDGKPDGAVSAAFANAASVTLNRYNVNATRKTDYNGDGRSDYAVRRPSDTVWYVWNSYFNTQTYNAFGAGSDVPVPGDYDGDHKTDLAVFRPSNKNWYILPSSGGSFYGFAWGASGDYLAPADYDGDGKTDVAVYRPSNGTWYIYKSSNGGTQYIYYGASGDIPVQGDYDGDGLADAAVYRPSDSTWYVLRTTTSSSWQLTWGYNTDTLTPGDYDGDCKNDVAVWRSSDQTWYIYKSSTGTSFQTQYGNSTDTPQPADFDGDGKTDFPLLARSTGLWSVLKSSNYGTLTQYWGASTDIPAASVFPFTPVIP